jgi:hypothetical protein
MPKALVPILFVTALAACEATPDTVPTPPARDHDARFVGTWIVDQPTHALSETTTYALDADGALRVVSSDPADCSGHLARHGVTGSVGKGCGGQDQRCTPALSCVFGKRWYSLDVRTLVIVGDCSDGQARDLRFDVGPDAAEGYVDVELVSVGGETDWGHDNWPWGSAAERARGRMMRAC